VGVSIHNRSQSCAVDSAFNFTQADRRRRQYESSSFTLLHFERRPPITAQDITGQNITIRFDEIERPTLLYVFSPSCGWCKKNEDKIKALTSQTGNTIRIIGISLSPDGLGEYVARRFPPVKVIKPDEQTIAAYKLSGTPETILVSSGELC